MKFQIKNKEYSVIIEKKNNKNTYIRVKSDKTIYVTTSYFTTKKQIEQILENNISSLIKMIDRVERKSSKEENFYYLGNTYQIIYMPTKLEIHADKIFVSNELELIKWLKKETKNIFQNRLDFWYNCFNETIPFPKLKIRTMKTRWGVCNRKDNSVTLNSELIKYDMSKIDYVIIHELSHFIHFNHSKDFWILVSKYCPNYKQIRKDMRE